MYQDNDNAFDVREQQDVPYEQIIARGRMYRELVSHPGWTDIMRILKDYEDELQRELEMHVSSNNDVLRAKLLAKMSYTQVLKIMTAVPKDAIRAAESVMKEVAENYKRGV